jgi:LPS O-antigen subunit length determinant protein (WzzB/FepE family)
MTWDIIPAIIGFIASIVASGFAYLAKERWSSRRDREMKELYEVALSIGPVSVKRTLEGRELPSSLATPELLQSIEQSILARLESRPGATKEETRKELERQLNEVHDRIRKIEERFPADATLEKIASINDALLAQRIDQLAKQIDGFESRILTKWDVALTTGTMLAGIISVVGATYAVLKVTGVVP